MKFFMIFSSLFILQVAQAQTLKEQKRKEEMLKRVDEISASINGARDDLQASDVSSACVRIQVAFSLYDDHLISVGSHMEMFKGRTSKLKETILQELVTIHKQKNKCESKDNENVDPKIMDKELKKISKSLNKQRRLIERKDTDRNNSFSYEYRF